MLLVVLPYSTQNWGKHLLFEVWGHIWQAPARAGNLPQIWSWSVPPHLWSSPLLYCSGLLPTWTGYPGINFLLFFILLCWSLTYPSLWTWYSWQVGKPVCWASSKTIFDSLRSLLRSSPWTSGRDLCVEAGRRIWTKGKENLAPSSESTQVGELGASKECDSLCPAEQHLCTCW